MTVTSASILLGTNEPNVSFQHTRENDSKPSNLNPITGLFIK